MAADKGPDKLKELEENIAKELNQKVSLSQPSDPRIDGSVQLNPTLDLGKSIDPQGPSIPVILTNAAVAAATAQISEKPINSDRRVEDITLEEVDALLSEVDETFDAKLKSIKAEVGSIELTEDLQSISISADYLKDDKDDSTAEQAAKEIEAISEKHSVELTEDLFETDEESLKDIKKSFWRHLRGVVTGIIVMPVDAVWSTGRYLWKARKNPPKQILRELSAVYKPVFSKRQTVFQEFFEHVGTYTPMHYLKLILLIAMVYGLRFIAVDITHNIRTPQPKDPFLKTFEEVATDKKHLSEDVTDTKAVPIPEFVVALPRIVATLHAPSPRRHPMVAMELFIEGSDRETAVEISKRRLELRDAVARILEQMTFEEMDTGAGKDTFKLRVRRACNKLLNNGRVKQVFFKSIQIHE